MRDLNKIIKPFFSTDETRPLWMGAMYDGSYGNATDGNAIIRWKDNSIATDGKVPNFKAVFDKEFDTSTIFIVSDYLEWKKSLPLVPDYTECEYCEGNGEVTWEFEHFSKYDTCPHCEGDGGFKNYNLMVPDPKEYYEFVGIYLSQKQIDKLVHVLKYIDKTEVVIETNSKNPQQAVFAKVEGFEILIMPCFK